MGGAEMSVNWASGHIPVLALDPQGNPRAAFVAKHQYAGADARPGHYGESCGVSTDVKLARFAMFPQPSRERRGKKGPGRRYFAPAPTLAGGHAR